MLQDKVLFTLSGINQWITVQVELKLLIFF